MSASMPGLGLRQSQSESAACGQKNTASMRPPRSRTINFTWRVCGAGSEANWTKVALALDRQLRDIGDLIHRFRQAAQKREPIGAQRRVLRHDQDVVEEAIDACACGSERAQSLGVFATIDMPMHDGK